MGHLSTIRNSLISIMLCSFVLLSSLLAIVASQGGQGPHPFEAYIPFIEQGVFGTWNDMQTYDCNIKGCKWSEFVVHDDWMFYGAGWGNQEAMNPMACAKRCALDVECGSFEF